MRSIRFVSIALLASIAALPGFAGSLTPPGPPAPTMKALDVVEPKIPISSLPFVITVPGSYYLTQSLTLSGNGTGISVNASPVTIDLRGFSIEGDGVSVFSYGIAVGPDDVAISNGTIRNFGYGIFANQGGVHRLERLTIRESQTWGAYLQDGFVHDCAFLFNRGPGLETVGSSLIANSRFLANTGLGLFVFGERSLVENCVIDANGGGGAYLGRGGTIRHSIVCNSTGPGIQVQDQTLVADNNVFANTGVGVLIAAGAGSRIDGNNITSSGSYAISTLTAGNIILRNTLHANVGTIFLTGSNVAPLETGTVTNAASNVSY